MGIIGVENFMERTRGCSSIVKIPYITSKDKRNVVVVDGNLFYEIYLFQNFNWICCSVIELVQEIRLFVKSFEDLGIKLVFFFSDGTEEEAMRSRWIKRRTNNVKFAMDTLSRGKMMQQVLGKIGYPNRPIQFKCSVISALQMLNCEVCCYLKDCISEVISYVRVHDCLAILSQNSFYVFCDIPCCYWSLKHFRLREMKTKQYNINKFANCLGLNKDILPLFAAIAGDNKHKEQIQSKIVKKMLSRTLNDLNTNNHLMLVATFIKTYFKEVLPENVPDILFNYFDENAEMIISLYFWLKNKCSYQNQESHNNEPNIINLSNWEKLKYISVQLNKKGNLCSKICLILSDRCYEEYVILEDFQNLPPNGLIYRPLRQRMYGLLFQDSPEVGGKIGVNEWCMQNGECPENSTTVLAEVMNDVPVVSLLTMWNVNDVGNYYDEKWQLFACCVSRTVDFRTFQELPSHLVIPTALLIYLHYEVPKNFDKSSYNLLMNWEIEVFIGVAVTLQATSLEYITSIKTDNLSVRAVKLIAMFLSGCHAIHMVADVCKCVIENQHLLSVWHYFDGKLFHHLYEQVDEEQQFDWEKYCGPECYGSFLKIRNIVFSVGSNDGE